MKIHHLIPILFLAAFCTLSAQTPPRGQSNQARLFVPFLDRESQSNVNVSVDFSVEQPCPPEFTNVLSNTNLFTSEEQRLIKEVFAKYKNVATNSGPPGSVLTDLHQTNYIIQAVGGSFKAEDWIAKFQYTNSDAYEVITFSGGVLARFRNGAKDGYNVSFVRTGGGTLLSFSQVKHDLPNGPFVRLSDLHPQGTTWDYRLANFDGSHLLEYNQQTNGMVLGKYLMWNPNGKVMLEADFKEPYDLQKHRIDLWTP